MIAGWEDVPLRAVCSIDKMLGTHHNLPYVGLEHIESGTSRFLGSLSPLSVKSTTFRFSNAHVLYGRLRPYLNKVLLPDFDGHCSTEIFPLLPSARLDRNFLCYWLLSSSTVAAIDATCTGARMPRANMDKVLDFYLPLPQLHAQRRIVAILDDTFEAIGTAKANTEKSLLNSQEVQDTHLAALLGSGQNWKSGPLSSFVEAISTGPFGSLLHRSDYVDDGVPLVNPINIVDHCIVPTEDKQVDEATAVRLRSYRLRSGDIVVGRRGEIGRCAVVSDAQDGWLCGTGCFFIRPSSQTEPSFIAHLIRSGPYRARLEALSTGATMQNLSNGALSNLDVALPSLAEQRRLLSAIDAVNWQIDQLCDVYRRKLTALDELKISLLHQAFTGALTSRATDKQLAELA